MQIFPTPTQSNTVNNACSWLGGSGCPDGDVFQPILDAVLAEQRPGATRSPG